ncbi:hypothetical protein [Timonella sp. A28]|uniref:hypothetical protein n=1 Tax=Timonella sp. A28 TaxID=3442640 RepID=UPI003EC02905
MKYPEDSNSFIEVEIPELGRFDLYNCARMSLFQFDFATNKVFLDFITEDKKSKICFSFYGIKNIYMESDEISIPDLFCSEFEFFTFGEEYLRRDNTNVMIFTNVFYLGFFAEGLDVKHSSMSKN